RRPLVAARAAAQRVRAERQQARRHRAVRRGLGRGLLNDPRGNRRDRADAGDRGRAVRAVCLARRAELLRQDHRGAAQSVRRPRREEGRLMAIETEQTIPLEEGLTLRRTPDPFVLVIFGASGDLTHKKLMPAIYALMMRRLLPPRFAIVGVARSQGDDDSFRADMKD